MSARNYKAFLIGQISLIVIHEWQELSHIGINDFLLIKILPITYRVLCFKPLIISLFPRTIFSGLFQSIISKAHKILFYSRILLYVDFKAWKCCN
ncbi:hypothetical protein EZS27_012252 [termite gut metagenome]|uniref:Uncharacterized protein n=1 Tax=termite gut metagenome TaxID=433724 RepID=A0A5J4S161_9ZZZZ